MKNESGQMAIVAVLIVVSLAVAIAIVAFLNQVQGRLGVSTQKRQMAHSAAEAGMDFALQTLASPTKWQNALVGFCPDFIQGGPNGTPIQFDPGNTGNPFTVQCSTGSNRGSYQITVLVTSYTKQQGALMATRALSANVSQRTLGATLSTGLTASAALETFIVPSGPLSVQWGPIVSYDPTNTWNLVSPMDDGRYPRKFAQSLIQGTLVTRPPPSDNLEYWSNSSVGYDSAIDTPTYVALAQNMSVVLPSPPTLLSNGSPLSPTCGAVANCGYFNVPSGDTAVFDAASPGIYTLNQPGAIVYVNGNVNFGRIAIDLKGDTLPSVFPSTGAFIIAGNLTLTSDNTASGQTRNFLRIPPTVAMEYPYTSSYPCVGQTGYCGTGGTPPINPIEFRGFLYVQGTLTQAVNPTTSFEIVGAVRVDGQLTAATGGTSSPLRIFYDDEINHSVLVNPFQLQIDSETVTVAH